MAKRHIKKLIAVTVGVAALVWLYRHHRRHAVRADHIDFADAPVTAPVEQPTAPPPTVATPPTDPRRVTMCDYATVIPIEGWAMAEPDPSAVPPNLQVALFTPGGAPIQEQPTSAQTAMIIFSIEDVRVLSLTEDEYVKRCISVAVDQAVAMSGGRIRPRITINEKCNVGPFTHLLEYVDNTQVEEFRVTTYLALKGTTGLSFQKMSPRSSMDPGIDALRQMAESVTLDLPSPAVPFTSHYFIRRYTEEIELKAEPLWTMRQQSPALAVLVTVDGDTLQVFRNGEVPKSYLEAAETGSSVVDGMKISQRGTTSIISSSYAEVVHTPPTSKTSAIHIENLAAFVKSVRPAQKSSQDGDTFVAVKEQLSFVVEPKGCVIPPQVNSATMNYLPLHNPVVSKSPPSESSMVSCGIIFDPMKASLEEWSDFLLQSGVGRAQRHKVGKYDGITVSQQSDQHPAIMMTIVVPTREMSYCFQWESHLSLWDAIQPIMENFAKTLRLGNDCVVS